LAAQLGVGRSSIREAINVLTAKGYLEAIHGRGTFIREGLSETSQQLEKLSTAVQVSSIYCLIEARALLECKSAALAAVRAEPRDLERLDEILVNISRNKDDYEVFLKYDIDFHNTIAEATRNDVICEMTKLVLSKLAEHHAKLKTEVFSPAYKRLSIDTAMNVINAIKAGKESEASSAMAHHLSAIEHELTRVL
jgi:DNA-binding FadR family transcriptional regulator